MAELHPKGDEASPPNGALGCSASKPPFLPLRDRKQIPPVRGQLVAYSCLSVHVHSLPPSCGSSPTSAPTPNPPLPTGARGKMVAPAASVIVLLWNKDSTNSLNSGWRIFFRSTGSPVVAAAICASWSPPQRYLRFEAVTSNSLCLSMQRKRFRGGVMNINHYVEAHLNSIITFTIYISENHL